jgi:hypothetical protein
MGKNNNHDPLAFLDPSSHECACGEQAVVGLNDGWLCLGCYEKVMERIGQAIDRFVRCTEAGDDDVH